MLALASARTLGKAYSRVPGDIWEKARLLSIAAQYDVSCGGCKVGERVHGEMDRWIYPSHLPDGRSMNLLKVLQTNACIKDCYYCENRAGRHFDRFMFQPEELAKVFYEMHLAGVVAGLFLSSGIVKNSDYTMERMLATAEILRARYRYQGYIHLKIMPGSSQAAVERAVQLADRVSLNLEAPSPDYLRQLSSTKDFIQDMLTPMRWVKELQEDDQRRESNHRFGQTTQLIVGGAGESDVEILRTTTALYNELNLVRVYFSAFQPVPDTPLEDRPPTPLMREHRLYQTDYLFRKYHFKLDELIFNDQGNLPLEADPKLVWALRHPEYYPVEITKVDREVLLRVPGIGPKSAMKIFRGRRWVSDLSDLRKLGAVAQRAAPFITIRGVRPAHQLAFWDFVPAGHSHAELLMPLMLPELESLGAQYQA